MAKATFTEQITNFYKRLGSPQKIILIAGSSAVVIALLILLAATSKKTDLAVLYSSLDQAEASKIVDKLKEQSIKYELKDGGSTILVDKNKLYETRLSMAKEGIPESGVIGYELFDKTNLGMSEFVQKINYRRAVEGELSRTIKSLDEVKDVRVHIVIPEKALFEKDQKHPTASVTLHLKQNKTLPKSSVLGIQNLVSNSIEGMSPNEVTVIDQKGKILSETQNESSSLAGLTAAQYEQQIKVEQYMTNKVQSLLDGVLGQGNSEVRINSELDFTQIDSTTTDYDPQRQAVRSEQQLKDETATRDSIINNSFGDTSRMRSAVITNNQNSGQVHTQSNSISNYEIKKTVSRKVEEIGNIKKLSCAVMINGLTKVHSDDQGLKTLEYRQREQQELQKIEEIVKNAVGYDSTRGDKVSVVNVRFDNTDALEEEVQGQQPVPFWKDPENIKIFTLIFAIVVTLIIMYRILHSRPLNERIRIAMSLPEHVNFDEREVDAPQKQLQYQDFDFGKDQLMLLPAELPEQLLLEGERLDREAFDLEFEEKDVIDKDALTQRAKASLAEGDYSGMNEDTILRLEIKGKVQEYFAQSTNDALRLVRAVLSQDYDEKAFKMD